MCMRVCVCVCVCVCLERSTAVHTARGDRTARELLQVRRRRGLVHTATVPGVIRQPTACQGHSVLPQKQLTTVDGETPSGLRLTGQ